MQTGRQLICRAILRGKIDVDIVVTAVQIHFPIGHIDMSSFTGICGAATSRSSRRCGGEYSWLHPVHTEEVPGVVATR